MTFESWFGPEPLQDCPVCRQKMSYAFTPAIVGDVEQRLSRYQVCQNRVKGNGKRLVQCENLATVNVVSGSVYQHITQSIALSIEATQMVMEG
jgi:hypothetical protein